MLFLIVSFLAFLSITAGTNVRVLLDNSNGSDLKVNYACPVSGQMRQLTLSHEDSANGVNMYTVLLPLLGPIAIQNTDIGFEMVLNSTDENFISSCSPDSILESNLSNQYRAEISISSFDHDIYSYRFRRGSFQIEFNTASVGSIPERLFEFIIERFRTLGANIDDREVRFPSFHNCDTALITRLPILEYIFGEGGRISIDPMEYVSVNDEYGVCQLELTSCGTDDCLFNPLSLRNINIRLTPQHTLQLCDSV